MKPDAGDDNLGLLIEGSRADREETDVLANCCQRLTPLSCGAHIFLQSWSLLFQLLQRYKDFNATNNTKCIFSLFLWWMDSKFLQISWNYWNNFAFTENNYVFINILIALTPFVLLYTFCRFFISWLLFCFNSFYIKTFSSILAMILITSVNYTFRDI